MLEKKIGLDKNMVVKKILKRVVKLIGLDFDNTIVSYDKAFYLVALCKNLIPKSLKKRKLMLRNIYKAKIKKMNG